MEPAMPPAVEVPDGAPAPNGFAEKQFDGDIAYSSSYKVEDQLCERYPGPKAKRKPKDETIVGALCAAVVEHQIGISVNLLTLLFLTHLCFPRARRRTTKYFRLSYYNPDTGGYGAGIDDLYFITFWIVCFTGLRVAVMDYLLMPWAISGGITKKKAQVRFAEQAWLLVYYIPFWALGMYIMYTSSPNYWFNLQNLWIDWPIPEVNAATKWYYLAQLAFWLQQILVVNIEERRKDYAHMFTHHIITSTVMFFSWASYQTRVGTAILCAMDVVDILLPAAKVLKYLGYQTACDIAFGVFILVWFVARHIFYNFLFYSVYAHSPSINGCYSSITGERISHDGGTEILPNVLQAFRNPGGIVCYSPNTRNAFLALLGALQCIALLWFYMIIRVAITVLSGKPADDSRSDDEDDEDDNVEDLEVDHPQWNGQPPAPAVLGGKQPEAKPKRTVTPPAANMVAYEEEVGVEGLHFARRNSRRSSPTSSRGKTYKSRASGISIPGHSDRKELLGRIGCDKPVNDRSE